MVTLYSMDPSVSFGYSLRIHRHTEKHSILRRNAKVYNCTSKRMEFCVPYAQFPESLFTVNYIPRHVFCYETHAQTAYGEIEAKDCH